MALRVLRHGLDADHEFLVLALGVVDQGHGRLGDGGQVGDLARVVHAQLEHRQRCARAGAARSAAGRCRCSGCPVARRRPRPRPRKIAAIISLTVVLPLLPVTATAAA
jgi:hypothetical protein